jgi:hypothetical protein
MKVLSKRNDQSWVIIIQVTVDNQPKSGCLARRLNQSHPAPPPALRKGCAFPGTYVVNNLLRAGWKAQASSLRGGGPRAVPLAGKPEAFRKTERQSRTEDQHELLIWTALVYDRRFF